MKKRKRPNLTPEDRKRRSDRMKALLAKRREAEIAPPPSLKTLKSTLSESQLAAIEREINPHWPASYESPLQMWEHHDEVRAEAARIDEQAALTSTPVDPRTLIVNPKDGTAYADLIEADIPSFDEDKAELEAIEVEEELGPPHEAEPIGSAAPLHDAVTRSTFDVRRYYYLKSIPKHGGR